MKIRERPPLMLRNINGGPLGGAEAEDLGAPTINTKKHRRRAPGGAKAEDPGAPTINAKKCRWWAPKEVPMLVIQEHPPST
jgi:hypothetical protein